MLISLSKLYSQDMFENGSFLRRRKRYKRPNSDLIKEANKYANLHLYSAAAAAAYLRSKSHEQLVSPHPTICPAPPNGSLLAPYLSLPIPPNLPPIVLPPQAIANASPNAKHLFPASTAALNLPTLTNQTVLNANLLNDAISASNSSALINARSEQLVKSESSPQDGLVVANLSAATVNGHSSTSPTNLNGSKIQPNLVSRTIETLNEMQRQTSALRQSPVLDNRIPLSLSSLPNNQHLSNTNDMTAFDFSMTNTPSNSLEKTSPIADKQPQLEASMAIMNSGALVNSQLNSQLNGHFASQLNEQLNAQLGNRLSSQLSSQLSHFSSHLNQSGDQKELNENLLGKLDKDKSKCSLTNNLNNLFINHVNSSNGYPLNGTNYPAFNQNHKALLPELENFLSNAQYPSLTASHLAGLSPTHVQSLINNHALLSANSLNNLNANNLNANNLNANNLNVNNLNANNLNSKLASPTTDKLQRTKSYSPSTVRSPCPPGITSTGNLTSLQDNKYILYRPF